MGQKSAGDAGGRGFCLDERVIRFDGKITELEERRNSGVGGMNMGMIMANGVAVVLMIVPMGEMFREMGWYWSAFQGVTLFLGMYFRMQWLFGLESRGKMVSWREYLKYVPVDWRAYRRQRLWVLCRYTARMFLCFAVLRGCLLCLSAVLMGTGFHWEEIGYAAGICIVWILAPGLVMVWRYT